METTPSRARTPSTASAARGAPPAHILVVDDEESIRIILHRALAREYRVTVAEDGEAALRLMKADPPDLVLSDLLMPGIHGTELLRQAKIIDPAVGFIILTGIGGLDSAAMALRLQADAFLQKPFSLQDVRFSVVRALHHRSVVQENQRFRESLDSPAQGAPVRVGVLDALSALIRATERRDGYQGYHTERVARLATAIGLELGLDGDELVSLRLGGLLYDIGKISIPDRILGKAGALTREEYAIVQTHPAVGATMIESNENLAASVPGVRHHHEHWDGSGYPDHLSGEEIPLAGRIIAAADAFDAMVTPRPYRAGRPVEAALTELRYLSDVHFDGRIIEAMIRARAAGLPQHPAVAALMDTRMVDAG